MEFLRRLRFLWAVICLLAAAACALGYAFGAAPSALFFSLAALFLGLAPYMQGSRTRMLSVMWLGGAGALAVAGGWPGGLPLVAQALAVVAGLWTLAKVTVWVLAGFFRKISGQTE